MFRFISSAVLVALTTFLASCSIMPNTYSPWLRDKIKYAKWSMVEGHRTVKGKVELKPAPRTISKILVSERFGGQVEAYLPDNCPIGSFPTLDPTKTYEVELLTRIYRDPDYVFNDVLNISHRGVVIYDASICLVHNLPMERLIEHGMSSCDAPSGFFPAQQKTFPNDGNAYLACGSGLRHPTWKCPACARAFNEWHLKRGILPEW